MVGTTIKAIFLILLFSLSGCFSEMDDANVASDDLLSTFDFEDGEQGWEGGISDFPIDEKDSSDYSFSNIQVPVSLSLENKGLNISADNPHGDLFYYFKRKVSDLGSNITYKIDFEFLVYTQLSQSETTSSEEIYLKVGAVNYEPNLQQLLWKNSENYFVLNIDKGETNSESGKDIVNVGSVKEFTSDTPDVISGNTFDFNIEVESNKNGEVWLVIGVDSGFKSQLTFGLAALTVYYRKQN